MKRNIIVGISDYKVAKSPNKLITYALGSCVGTAIYDRENKIGGLSHILLYDSTLFENVEIGKFADTAIPSMVNKLLVYGAKKENFIAHIAGGANTFLKPEKKSFFNIGSCNVKAVRAILNELNIPILSQEVGGYTGRTMSLDLDNFKVSIKNASSKIKIQ